MCLHPRIQGDGILKSHTSGPDDHPSGESAVNLRAVAAFLLDTSP